MSAETVVKSALGKKTLIALAAVYGAGVAYELYVVPATDPDKMKKAFGWPYYFGLGIAGVITGTHTFTPFQAPPTSPGPA